MRRGLSYPGQSRHLAVEPFRRWCRSSLGGSQHSWINHMRPLPLALFLGLSSRSWTNRSPRKSSTSIAPTATPLALRCSPGPCRTPIAFPRAACAGWRGCCGQRSWQATVGFGATFGRGRPLCGTCKGEAVMVEGAGINVGGGTKWQDLQNLQVTCFSCNRGVQPAAVGFLCRARTEGKPCPSRLPDVRNMCYTLDAGGDLLAGAYADLPPARRRVCTITRHARRPRPQPRPRKPLRRASIANPSTGSLISHCFAVCVRALCCPACAVLTQMYGYAHGAGLQTKV